MKSDIEESVASLLKKEREPLKSKDIASALSLDMVTLAKALFSLDRKGIIERVYTDEYDPTRPFDTVSWKYRKEATSSSFKLVMTTPISLYETASELLNRYNAVDFADAYNSIIEIADREIKIVCPYIDAYGLYPLVFKIKRNRSIKIRIITEVEKSHDVLYFRDVAKKDRVLIADSSRSETFEQRTRKVAGIHAKMVVADHSAALLGSFNLSRYHYMVNIDLGLLIYDANFVRVLSSLFDELWRSSNVL